MKEDILLKEIFNLLSSTHEPLETKEIEAKIIEMKLKEHSTRTKVFYRLNILRGDGKIKGKFVGPGKGVWIWWMESTFGKKTAS